MLCKKLKKKYLYKRIVLTNKYVIIVSISIIHICLGCLLCQISSFKLPFIDQFFSSLLSVKNIIYYYLLYALSVTLETL